MCKLCQDNSWKTSSFVADPPARVPRNRPTSTADFITRAEWERVIEEVLILLDEATNRVMDKPVARTRFFRELERFSRTIRNM